MPMSGTTTKPYLLRALYEWCTDNGFTPYIVSMVDSHARVPREFVKNGEIVLNISFSATAGLKMDNDFIRFNARFGGVSREIEIPVANVLAIYARENGQGMAFEVARPSAPTDKPVGVADAGAAHAGAAHAGTAAVEQRSAAPGSVAPESGITEGAPGDDPLGGGGRPRLKRIK